MLLTETNIPSSIADSFSNQLAAAQRFIDLRINTEPTTLQELDMQTKLLNNIIKVKKYNTANNTRKLIADIVKLVANADKDIAELIATKYARVLGINDFETILAADTAIELQPTPATAVTEQARTTEIQTQIQDQPQHINGDTPPITLAEFEQEKARLADYESGHRETTVIFKGHEVSKTWLDYNLLQFYLPIEKRRFIANELDYPRLINHSDTRKTIRQVLQKVNEQSAA